MKQVIINATAARTSGALTILKDFMSYLYGHTDGIFLYHLLTTTKDVFKNVENIMVHEILQQNWRTRILWDKKGFQKWCENNNIIPDVVISFQNTCSRLTGKYRNVKWLVYYHQPLPLIKYPWNLLDKNESKLFLYAHFYKFFVNRWNKNAEYVVQLPYIKKMFCNKFKNITPEKVHIIRPNLPNVNTDSLILKKIDDDKKLFIYPATPLEYKNHKVILDAVEFLKNDELNIVNKIKIIFTVPKDSQVAQFAFERGLDGIINCIGSIPYDELLTYYKCCDALLFPSKIESFGLPLVEAALFGVPIIAADLPYAKEVLENYDGATFADVDNPRSWIGQIKQLLQNNKKYKPLTQKVQNTWKEFIDVMNSLLQK